MVNINRINAIIFTNLAIDKLQVNSLSISTTNLLRLIDDSYLSGKFRESLCYL
jgi:hypothetical protein